MKAMRLTLIASVFAVGWAPWLCANNTPTGPTDQSAMVAGEMQDFLPKLDEIVKEYPGDSDFQMGASILFGRYARYNGVAEDTRAESHLRESLKTDSHNKAAWALRATSEITLHSAIYRDQIQQLEWAIENADTRGADHIFIYAPHTFAGFVDENGNVHAPWRDPSPLYEYFAHGSGLAVDMNDVPYSANGMVIKNVDYAKAREVLKAKLASKLRDAMETCHQAEKEDPDNSLYNYLRAHAYLVLGQEGAAMTELQVAAQKKYLATYVTETRNAVARVLREGGFSDQVTSQIVDKYAPFGYFISHNLLRPYLQPLCERHIAQRNVKGANEIAEMILSIARQIREEPVPFAFNDNQRASAFLEKWVGEKKTILQRTGPSGSNSPAASPPSQ